ncbi:MAG: secondary thiamine-phosphate synthase enzyme YjbQ [bacterium]
MVHGKQITLSSQGFSDIHDITAAVREIVNESPLQDGIACVFNVGSTGTITTMEYEPALVQDVQEQLEKYLPSSMTSHHSQTWGDDNGFSHLRASFMGPGITVPFQAKEMQLGAWQQIVVIDHDNRPRQRRVFVQLLGE